MPGDVRQELPTFLPSGWVHRKGWHFYVMGSRYPVCQRAIKRRAAHEFRDWVPSTEPDRCRECRAIKATLAADPSDGWDPRVPGEPGMSDRP